jgi:hypothetical protein
MSRTAWAGLRRRHRNRGTWGRPRIARTFEILEGRRLLATSVLSINSVEIVESSAGETGLAFTVTLDPANIENAVTVDYRTADESARAGSDYVARNGTLTFLPDDVEETIFVPLLDDLLAETTETFRVILSNPVNAEIGVGEGIGTIRDDDTAGILRIGPDVVVQEADGTVTLRVFRDAGNGGDVTVRYATADDTALAGADYQAVSGTLTFGPNQSDQAITIPLLRDLRLEGTEAFSVVLSDPGGGGLLDPRSVATVTLLDSDSTVVINTNDSGYGSLRDAILVSNTTPGRDTILFDVPGVAPFTFLPQTPLPAITDPVDIDGTSQPGFTASSILILDGTLAGPGANGLAILAGTTTVQGLTIVRFAGSGILIQGGGQTRITGNILGQPGQANGVDGVAILDSSGNQIGGDGGSLAPSGRLGVRAAAATAGNLIAGNTGVGVRIIGSGSHDNVIIGNMIGTDAPGLVAQPNGAGGIRIEGAPNNRIGGLGPSSGNLISGNGGAGVQVVGAAAVGNQLIGNRIGTDAGGTARLGNLFDGVFLDGAPGCVVGGTAAGAANLISGNGLVGVRIAGSSATGNQVIGNRIGTNANGTARLGNTYDGVFLSEGATNNTIGGAAPGSGNLISGNGSVGIQIFMTETRGNVVLGNRIGTNAAGDRAIANTRDGVFINQAPGNTIGLAGAGNLISGNGSVGLQLFGAGSSGNVVQGNRIGTDALGAPRLGNAYGLFLNAAPNNLIGGPGGARNVIAGNRRAQVIEDGGRGGPVVVAASSGGDGAVTSVTVTFSKEMNAARAMDVGRYRLSLAGGANRPRTGANQAIGVARAAYDSFRRAVVLTLSEPVALGTKLRLIISGRGRGGLTDTANRLLDGDNNGRPGGDANVIVDADLSRAVLKATRLGVRVGGGPAALRRR